MALVTPTKKKPALAHKKRVGQHHKHSKHYLKHYWPYVPMLLVVGLGLLVSSIWSNHAVLGATNDYSAQALLDTTNADRAANGLAALSTDPQLNAAAAAKAKDMVAQNYWAHDTPSGKTPWDFITSTGYQYQLAGENLAYGFGDAASTETGWMNSPEHKENILNGQYSQVGFATVQAPNYLGHGPTTLVVAEYAAPVPVVAHVTFTVPNPTTPAVAKLQNRALDAQPVSRIQLLTNGKAPWSVLVLSIVATAALTVFLLRHGFALHKLLQRGEHFALQHVALDTLILAVAVFGFLLTRTVGVTL